MKIKPKLMWRRTTKPGVADNVRARADEAAQLAKIPGQNRLTDPRTNPAVRAYADELLNDRQRQQLGAEHSRIARRYRVQDRRASRAEQALAALQDARDAGSAAKAVLALHAGRNRFMGAALAASLTLSAGSAMGVENLAVEHNAHPGSGYIAEIGLTGLTTAVILYRSHIAQNGGATSRLYGALMWVLMVAPLAASMTANAVAAGAVGVFCSVGAAAFSLLSYIIADTSAASILQQANRVSDDDESALQEIASGDDLLAQPERVPQTFFDAQAMGLPFTPLNFQPPTVLVSTPVVDAPRVPTRELNASDHQVATPTQVATGRSAHPDEHIAMPIPEPTPVATSEHKPNAHGTAKPSSDHPSAVSTSEQKPEPTQPVATQEPMATERGVATRKSTPKPTGAKTPGKRRTRDQIRAELQKALKEHYDNGGGEPQVKPLADKLNVNRRIVRELLDEMNVRPMIRKAANQ